MNVIVSFKNIILFILIKLIFYRYTRRNNINCKITVYKLLVLQYILYSVYCIYLYFYIILHVWIPKIFTLVFSLLFIPDK